MVELEKISANKKGEAGKHFTFDLLIFSRRIIRDKLSEQHFCCGVEVYAMLSP